MLLDSAVYTIPYTFLTYFDNLTKNLRNLFFQLKITILLYFTGPLETNTGTEWVNLLVRLAHMITMISWLNFSVFFKNINKKK